MNPIHPVWALAALHPRWGNRYTGSCTKGTGGPAKFLIQEVGELVWTEDVDLLGRQVYPAYHCWNILES